MTAWGVVRLVLFAASALGIVVVAWLWWREGRPVLAGRGEVADAPPKAGTLDCGCTSAVIYGCIHCGDTRCAAHRGAIHPCSQGDPGEALCTEPAGTPDDFALWTREMGADR